MSAGPGPPLKPLALRREGSGLRIDWSDGRSGLVSFADLRAACPCAGCQEERARPPDPFRVLQPQELIARDQLAPKAMVPRGHYAYQIAWNDGHDTGIYTIEKLRELCQLE
jgi:DUF971 family protein